MAREERVVTGSHRSHTERVPPPEPPFILSGSRPCPATSGHSSVAPQERAQPAWPWAASRIGVEGSKRQEGGTAFPEQKKEEK